MGSVKRPASESISTRVHFIGTNDDNDMEISSDGDRPNECKLTKAIRTSGGPRSGSASGRVDVKVGDMKRHFRGFPALVHPTIEQRIIHLSNETDEQRHENYWYGYREWWVGRLVGCARKYT